MASPVSPTARYCRRGNNRSMRPGVHLAGPPRTPCGIRFGVPGFLREPAFDSEPCGSASKAAGFSAAIPWASLAANPGVRTMPAVPDPLLSARTSPRLPPGSSATAPCGLCHRVSASYLANQAIGVARTNLAAHPSQSRQLLEMQPNLAVRVHLGLPRRKRRRLAATITTRRIARGAEEQFRLPETGLAVCPGVRPALSKSHSLRYGFCFAPAGSSCRRLAAPSRKRPLTRRCSLSRTGMALRLAQFLQPPRASNCSLRSSSELQGCGKSTGSALRHADTRPHPAASRPAFPCGRLAGGPEIPPGYLPAPT